MAETPTRTEALAPIGLLALAVVSGVLATPPWLSLSFWIGHPWLTIPLFLRARDASSLGIALPLVLRRCALAGFVSGAIVGAGVAIVERWRTGHTLPSADLHAHLVYPLVGILFAAVAGAVGHRFGAPASDSDS